MSATGVKSAREFRERRLARDLAHGMGGGGAERDPITSGAAFATRDVPGHAARAADVLDVHGLAQNLGQAGGDDAAEDVVLSSGGKRHHQGHRPARPVLRPCRPDARKARGERHGEEQPQLRHCSGWDPSTNGSIIRLAAPG